MFIIYIFLIIYLFLIFSLLFTIKENTTHKYLRNFNYKYIKNFNQVEIILLYDYIYKLIAMKKPLQLKKEYEEEGADFIKRIKKIIEYKLYLIIFQALLNFSCNNFTQKEKLHSDYNHHNSNQKNCSCIFSCEKRHFINFFTSFTNFFLTSFDEKKPE